MASATDIIGKKISEAVKNGAIQVGDAAVEASVALIKNGIREALSVKGEKPKLASNRSDAASRTLEAEVEDYEDENEDEEVDGEYDNGEESPIPIGFNAFDRDGNLECAVATFRLWGTRNCDVVASNPTTGISFVGTMDDLQQFCQHNDLDDEWELYGVKEDGSLDSSEIDDMQISKSVVKYIASQLIAMNYDHSKMSEEFKTNHVAKGQVSVARMLVNIPYLSGVPMAHFAVPYAIIYGAEKDGKFDTYIHEFGENSKLMPTMYTVGDGKEEPRSLVIHGGDMVVKKGFICH